MMPQREHLDEIGTKDCAQATAGHDLSSIFKSEKKPKKKPKIKSEKNFFKSQNAQLKQQMNIQCDPNSTTCAMSYELGGT